jgi:hypothetical protein
MLRKGCKPLGSSGKKKELWTVAGAIKFSTVQPPQNALFKLDYSEQFFLNQSSAKFPLGVKTQRLIPKD